MSEIKSRKPYIVVFGSQNVGKSTLVGYLFTKEWSEEKFLLEENKMKIKIGSEYDFRSRLALFVDTARDEYKQMHEDGGSKHIHIKEVGEFTWIDTPGASTQRKERYKGVFLGEIGLFLIELETILDLIQSNRQSKDYHSAINLFGSLLVWQRLKPHNKYLIGLTKIDIRYDESLIFQAIQFIKETIANDNLMSIIPISIDVKKRTDMGVTTKTVFCSSSLIDKIGEIGFISSSRNSEKAFLVNDKRYPNVNGQGEIFRWKINSGTVNYKDNLQIIPVLYKNRITAISAEVGSIHDINKKEINHASSGDVISIRFKKFVDQRGRSINKNDIQFTKTSIAIDEKSNYVFGNQIFLEIDKSDCNEIERRYIDRIKEKSPIWIAWFGRMICTNLINKVEVEGSRYIRILLQTDSVKQLFSLPKEEGTIHEKCIVQIKEQNGNYPIYLTYKATVKDIGMSNNMKDYRLVL